LLHCFVTVTLLSKSGAKVRFRFRYLISNKILFSYLVAV
jgi:hypothetical protein